jgi:hypothetical protein
VVVCSLPPNISCCVGLAGRKLNLTTGKAGKIKMTHDEEIKYIHDVFTARFEGKATSLGMDISMALLSRMLGTVNDDQRALLDRHFPERPVKRVELSLEDKVAFGNKWVDEIVEVTQKAIDQFCPQHKFTIEVEYRGSEELQIVIQGAGFSLDLIEVERPSIGRIRVLPGWQLTGYKTHPASRWHPEEIEDVPISEHQGHWEAIGALIKAIHGDEVDGWMGAEGEARWLEQNKDFPDHFAADE